MADIGRIAVRGTDRERVLAVVRAHWGGCPQLPPESVRADPLGLQQRRTDSLGYVVRELPGGWILVADSEEATADAALAEHLAESLGVPVLWVVSVESADAARVTWFGSDEHREPDERAGPAALEAWLDEQLSGWRSGWADPGGSRAAFHLADADLYVEDSAWLTAIAAQAGVIQVRAGDGVDTEAVVREVDAYWRECGARPGDDEIPAEPCSLVTGTGDRLVVAVSPVDDGWITVVDSEREVADLGLADWLAGTLGADVAWYWVDSEEDTAAIRLLGFEDLTEEPADDPESVVAYASATFPQPFVPIDAIDGSWTRLGFEGVDPEQYVTDPEWLDEQLDEA